MGVAQKPGQKGCQALPSQGGMGGGAEQMRVEETTAKERAAGLGASSAVLPKTRPKRSQGRTGQTRATWAQGSPMTAVFRRRFPSCSRQEGGRPGDGRGEGERGGGK